MVKGWLQTALEKHIRTSVRYIYTAQGTWQELEDKYRNVSAPRTYEIHQVITLLQEGLSVVTFLHQIQNIL